MSVPAVRFRIDFGPAASVGPGKIALLEHIGASGSLSEAARSLGMSYRRAWQLLGSVNDCFDEPVAISSRGGRGGGGASLTECGRQLIELYRRFERETQLRAARCFRPLAGNTRPGGRRRATATVVHLSERRARARRAG